MPSLCALGLRRGCHVARCLMVKPMNRSCGLHSTSTSRAFRVKGQRTRGVCRLGRVPSAILKGCTALARLSLHGNPITIEQLREADGFAEFNARRCAKADKQLEMQVGAAACVG